ncbi:LysM peptidoglycan-binding domain-containing protein [Promicromonospora sp. NPDC060204]|uniref:LysM peptidoglycan-binding domain-containing protein n=1 Tax=Promicromonospora sp. NPDC060204 TaxID=3347071 RepID=UPI0036690082
MQHAPRIAAALAAAALFTTAVTVPLAAAAQAATTGPVLVGAAPTAVHAGHHPATNPLATATKDGEKVKYYVVPAKPEGEQEFLFDIAQRLLGDGNRYKEIFELNKGRTQPDGDALVDETVLLPGWVLQLPDDAAGEGVETGVLPTGPAEGAGEPSASPEASVAPSVPYYVIGETPEGEPEYLYLIAERFLGDGERNTEIFELNKGRTQPDGGKLTDPAVVTVGWVLQMPEDAKGEGLQNGPLPGPSAAPEANAPSEATDPAGADGSGGADEQSTGGSGLEPVLIGVGLAVVAAALVLLVVYAVRRSRSGRAQPFDDSLLRTDTSASWMVDRALRVLLASCERDGVEVPGITGVFIEGGAMRLRLAGPVSPAPEPWVANEDGQSWSAPLARLQAAPASEASTARFSRLVTIGVAETGRVLVDFARARGVISLDGPTRARHEVLRRWLGELTGNPWSNDPRVVMVGNGLPQPEQVEHLAAIEQVIPELDATGGGVLVLSQAPSVAQQDLLAARFADPRFAWVVIVLGESTSAKWRITAGDDGWLRSGFLPDVRYTEQTAVRRAGE